MISFKRHIAILLLLVISASIMPFNALHKHCKEAHVEALLSGRTKLHNCELDAYACQNVFKQGCEHKNHLKSTTEDCFTCNFHFIKSYVSSVQGIHNAVNEYSFTYAFPFYKHLVNIIKCAYNKGPPTVYLISIF